MASDELNDEELGLLKDYLWFYRELASCEREPTSEKQRHFVAVCEGRAKAETAHELAYIKYCRLNPPRPRSEDAERPEWCSNEDWKRMRGRQYGDMKKRHRGD